MNHANVYSTNNEEFEEYEDIESVMEAANEEDQVNVPDD